MTTLLQSQKPFFQPIDEYPDSDGKPMAETGVHVLAILHLLGALRCFMRKRRDVYIIGNMFFYYRRGDPGAHKAPDVMVIKGVDGTRDRRSYRLWEEGMPPAVVFEITSKATSEEDTENKPLLYAELGIKEYFLFDPLHEYLDEQLMGYRLVNKAYQPIMADADGDLYSEELRATLTIEGKLLRLVDPRTGAVVPALEEAVDLAEQEAQRAEQEAQRAEQETLRAEQETLRAEQETLRAEQETQRAELAEAEVARLRAILQQLGHNDHKTAAS